MSRGLQSAERRICGEINGMNAINCVVIGSGNIGTDLLFKLRRSTILNPAWMVGIDPQSEGLALARQMGVRTTDRGVDDLLRQIEPGDIQIAFDATSAGAHVINAPKLGARDIFMIDLTPAAIGPFHVPVVNRLDLSRIEGANVNMVSCGGQATIPIVSAIGRVQSVDYAEIVATVASKSAGPGTRKNIDEFTRTTARGLEVVGGAGRGKAIIILNPADPPLIMRHTIHCLTADDPNEEAIRDSVETMVREVQKYVPGYRVVNGPIFDGRRVSLFMEVEGLGDYLPSYSGNLDIMTAAAVRTAELFAEEVLTGQTR
jgi:acetaldehyde/propanal dehydrogenase